MSHAGKYVIPVIGSRNPGLSGNGCTNFMSSAVSSKNPRKNQSSNHSVILLSAFRRSSIASTILDYAAIVILIFSYFRAFSHKVEKRRKENLKYLNAIHPISNWFRLRRQRFEMRKNYKLFLCPKCKTTLRVPKGKGKINLTCPRCHTKFEGKS